MLERSFLFFWIFLLIFFRNFLSGVKYELNSGLKFFSPFLGLSHPVLAKNNAGKRFFKFFEFFFYFFRNFLSGVEYERNSGLKFFSPLLAQAHPVLAKNNAGKNFFIFFANFFSEFSFRGQAWTEFGTKIFFSLSRPISYRFG